MRRLVAIMLCLLPSAALLAEPPKDDDELARYDARIKPKDRQHWAFQPVRRPDVPAVKDRDWVKNEIDAFIQTRLEKEGWKPSPAVESRALVRRVYLDLLGLPPTPEQVDAFLKDDSPKAFAKLVDDLLASPHYGERWGRHWLDLVRYAETNGYERDATKPSVWRYRDYVIKAFNDDKRFDRFILEQLAGDELPDASTETLIATGYNRLGPWDDEPADPKEDRFDQLDDIVATTSQVFLGLTLNCARCHNHKFEPLTQHDYYRMVAIFNGLQRPQNGRTELDLLAGKRPDVQAVVERDRQLQSLALDAFALRLTTVCQPVAVANAFGVEEKMRRLRAQVPDLPRGYFLTEPTAKPPSTNLLLRGKATRPGPEVQPGVPAVLVEKQPPFPAPGEHTSLRRLTLAKWIANPDNPLTARVIVNRVWQFHFGEGIVRTPSDFGVQGEKPTHPELLDWLADWFVREGWSIKKLHRLILTSNTYRMSKKANADYLAKDPENRLWWRAPYRRLEVEAIRDSMLAVSGKLNLTMGGPSMYPHVPKEALEGHSDPDKIWKPLDEKDESRRTVYAFLKRSMVVPFLEVLDVCDTTRSSAKRNVTSVPTQALTLLNSDFTNRQARYFADRLLKEAGTDPAKQIDRAYRLALCRPPTATETATLAKFLKREAEQLRSDAIKSGKKLDPTEAERQALVQMCRVIFNLNEFVYAD